MNSQQNRYKVPQQQWNQWDNEGQTFFNNLYQRLETRRDSFISEIPNASSIEGSTAIDRILMDVCTEATQAHLQLQTQTH